MFLYTISKEDLYSPDPKPDLQIVDSMDNGEDFNLAQILAQIIADLPKENMNQT